jgi:hypothetical protein
MDSVNYLLLFLAGELAVVDNVVVGLVISERTVFYRCGTLQTIFHLCIPKKI